MQQTRWLFWLAALVTVAIVGLGIVTSPGPSTLPLGVAAVAGLVASWTARYVTGRAPAAVDVVDVVAITVASACGPHPAGVFICVIPAVFFRGLYGTPRRLLLYALGFAAGSLLSLPLWELLHALPLPDGTGNALAGYLTETFLIAGVSAFLARSLHDREQARLRDAALLRLGSRLVGLVDHEMIRSRSYECLVALCDATPGLAAVTARGTPDGLTVINRAGAAAAPAVVRYSDLYATTGVDPSGDAITTVGTGHDGRWLGIRMPLQHESWILLTAPGKLAEDVVVAAQSLMNVVVLALNTSDAHQDLTTQASTDALTGLANRAAFTRAFDAALAGPDPRLALMFLDLDDFKIVNDGLGNAAGDELLRYVASRLRSAVRSGDLCARLGGDEFAVLMPHADDGADTTGQRLVELVSTPVALRGHVAQVGASVGLAFATAGSTAELLMQQADIAMYAAKARGKNRVQVFDPGLLRDDGPTTFEAELAVAAAAGQLVVHYQPVMSVADGHCVAAEALVRWQHPTRGLLGPAEFIPTAEHTGAIIDIGAFVLRSACAEARGWPQALALHVNVSAAQLADPGFLDTVRDCTARFGLGPKQLVLEITESMVLDSPAIRLALDALVAIDVAVAIDDFGTGYSALTTLHTLPLSIVKIDKSFILGDASRAADEAVVGGIVQMAARLGLQVVAEGVERLDQQAFLRTVGVDAAQGYLYLRPTPAPEFAEWLRRHQRPRPEATVTTLDSRRAGPYRGGPA